MPPSSRAEYDADFRPRDRPSSKSAFDDEAPPSPKYGRASGPRTSYDRGSRDFDDDRRARDEPGRRHRPAGRENNRASPRDADDDDARKPRDRGSREDRPRPDAREAGRDSHYSREGGYERERLADRSRRDESARGRDASPEGKDASEPAHRPEYDSSPSPDAAGRSGECDDDGDGAAVAIIDADAGDKKKKRVRPLIFDSLMSWPADDATVAHSPFGGGPSLLKCCIRRTKTMFGFQIALVLEATQAPLLVAQKQHTSGNYHIFDVTGGTVGKTLKKKGGNYMGKIAAAAAREPLHRVLVDGGAAARRNECALFVHRRTGNLTAVLDGAKPRQICVVLPDRCNQKNLLQRFLVGDSELTVLEQRQPRLVGGQYSLNFFGRATVASVKNLQLTDKHDRVVFQLGKISNDEFNADFADPLSPFQAFALAVSQFI
ncbi:tubby C-terminal-like domain-containing protein [Pelagophyceae sp. CCMP2097]|nr:tubby C-terminal-like domain-containing protein [Pelagophyceae sp. CCMP2097]